MKRLRLLQYVVLAAVLTIYIALRFWNLTASCLWFDEIFSVHAAEHSWDSIFTFVAQDLIHPPLFYLLLKIWLAAGGEGLFFVRLFPVLFSILAVFPFLALCRELKLGFSSQVLAFFFLAVNGSLIKYSQEVRMYSLLLCLSLFSIWLFARYFYQNKSFVALLIVNILMIYSHYFGWFIVFAEVLAIVLYQKRKIKQVLLMSGIAFTIFLPWVVAVSQAAIAGSELGQNIGWMTPPGFYSIVQFVFNLIEPFYYAASSVDPMSIFRVSVPLLLLALTAAAFYFAGINQKSKSEYQSTGLLLIFFALPLLLAFLASWLLPYSVWGTRHVIIVFAPFALLLATVIDGITKQSAKTGLITLAILLSVYAFAIQISRDTPRYAWCAWETLAGSIDKNENARVYVFEDLVAYHFWFALREKKSVQVVKIENLSGVAEDKAYFLPRGFSEVQKASTTAIAGERILFAFRDTDWSEQRPPVSVFVDNGYKISLLQTVETQGIKSFLAEGRK